MEGEKREEMKERRKSKINKTATAQSKQDTKQDKSSQMTYYKKVEATEI